MTVTSKSNVLEIGSMPVIIGERINPTGKKALAEAYRTGNFDYIKNEAIAQQNAGAHLLDVNAGVAGLDEADLLAKAVKAVQEVCDLPLVIDSSNVDAIKAAIAVYDGKPIINSVNASESSLGTVLDVAADAGASLICLAMDESGIPATADGRYALASKIADRAAQKGISTDRLLFDALTTAACMGDGGPQITLDTIKKIKSELGAKTVLGVSNISFGLPCRDEMNSAFLAMALYAGLDAAIINPLSDKMMSSYASYLALSGLDEFCLGYVERYNK